MAKKHKSLDSELQIDSSNGLFAGQTTTSPAKASVEGEKPVTFTLGREVVTPEMKEKLLKYDEMAEQNSKLLADNDELTMKLASYIEELDALKSNKTESIGKAEADDLAQQVEAWKEKYATLRAAADKQLERISDLTFENANLNAQIRELTNGNVQTSGQIPAKPVRETKLETPPYNPYRTNGYSSWN